ncbi:MAG: serine/threonine protein kinase [Gemmataceae bacterium]|nr:serine/threonine protein kinase [Gemmataceae bacterium]
MGLIYIARQLDSGREVVVKVLKAQCAADPATRANFCREIQVLSRFQHPNVVEFHGGSLDDPAGIFLVMEYVRGRPLNRLLQERRRFAPQRIGRILVPLCDVLQSAHERGIVHCDVKPANIMVVHPDTPCETVKLMDFGLAKMPATLSLTALDMPNAGEVAAGSPGYMAPEQAAGHDVDHRADVYGVGVVLYELLTGTLPFERSSVAGLLAAQRYAEPPPFAERCPGLSSPRGVEALVLRCLAKHREQRPQSARELVRLYEQALGRQIVAPPRAAVTPASAPAAPATPPAMLQTPLQTPGGLVDPNAVVYKLEVCMSESIAMLKLRGFVHDLGGRLGDGEPGVIRVQLDTARLDRGGPAAPTPASTGLRSWFGGDRAVKVAPAVSVDISMEMRIERTDPKQPNRLTITVTLRARNNLSLSRRDLKDRYDRIHRELRAYLQATGS